MVVSVYNVEGEIEGIKLYGKRWFILLLFVLYIASSLIQYYHYTIIADVITQYYNVSYTKINWTALVMSIVFIVLTFPGNYLMDKIGLRNTVLVGTVGTCIGTVIKFASVHPDRFWVAILAQGVIGVFHTCMMPQLPKVTAVWFGIKEIATANALGLIGIQLGISLSFILPPMIVFKGKIDDIERRLNILNMGFSGFAIFMAILLYFFFSNAPPTPPSIAQKNLIKTKENKETSNFIYICKQLFSNKSYLLFIIVYAVNAKTISPFHTMLNEIVSHYYPEAIHHAGIIGLLLYFLGIIGSLGVGIILDKYKNFKVTIYSSYSIYFLSVALFIGVVNQGIPFMYVTAIIMGIADASLYTSAIELVMELTYPLPENVTLGFTMITTNIATVIIVSLYNFIFESVGILWANIAILMLIFMTNFLFYFIKFDLRRQSVQDLTSNGNIKVHVNVHIIEPKES